MSAQGCKKYICCVLCRYIQHNIRLLDGFMHPSLKATVDEMKWSDSGRVDRVLCGCIHKMVSYYRLTYSMYSLSIIQNNSIRNGKKVDNLE